VNKARVQSLLDAEVEKWSEKSFVQLLEELHDVTAYWRGENDDFHQFEVLLIEHEPDYVHVSISIDDGSFLRSFAPLTRGFIVRRDGRIEK